MPVGDDVDVGMQDGLPSSQAIIETDVETVRRVGAGEESLADLTYQCPDGLLLRRLQVVDGADVPAGHHQHMAIGYGEGIHDGSGMLVLLTDALSGDTAEGAGFQTGSLAPGTSGLSRHQPGACAPARSKNDAIF